MPSAAGVNPSSRPACPTVRGRDGFELRTGLVGKPGDRAVIDISENQPFVASERIDVRDLALEIDVVFRIDLKMDRDRWVNGRQLRPDPADL